MYIELYENKDMEWNITLLFLLKLLLYYLIQFCTGGATSPTSPPPGCRLSLTGGLFLIFYEKNMLNPRLVGRINGG